MPNVFPDDILARLRALETNVDTADIELGIQGGEIISYNLTTHVAIVLLDNGDIVNVTILNPGGDMTFGGTEGPVLVDRADGHTYRLKVTSGVLGTEVVT